MTPALGGALAGAAIVAGILLVGVGIVGTRGPARPAGRIGRAVRRLTGTDLADVERRSRRVHLAVALVALAAGGVYSGIPVVGIGLAVVVAGVPGMFGAARAETRMIERLEGIEVWTRRLSDLVRSGAGLHQAIIVGAADAAGPIAPQAAELAAELRGEVSTVEALRRFAARLADPHADEVVAALMLSAREHGPRLADVLDRIAENIAEVVTMRREQAASRTDARISALVLTGLTVAGLLVVLVNRSYMTPYHTAVGQLVLGTCLAAFAGLLLWCRTLAAPRHLPRLLSNASTGRREAGS